MSVLDWFKLYKFSNQWIFRHSLVTHLFINLPVRTELKNAVRFNSQIREVKRNGLFLKWDGDSSREFKLQKCEQIMIKICNISVSSWHAGRGKQNINDLSHTFFSDKPRQKSILAPSAYYFQILRKRYIRPLVSIEHLGKSEVISDTDSSRCRGWTSSWNLPVRTCSNFVQVQFFTRRVPWKPNRSSSSIYPCMRSKLRRDRFSKKKFKYTFEQ